MKGVSRNGERIMEQVREREGVIETSETSWAG